jgi:hypothetical protein
MTEDEKRTAVAKLAAVMRAEDAVRALSDGELLSRYGVACVQTAAPINGRDAVGPFEPLSKLLAELTRRLDGRTRAAQLAEGLVPLIDDLQESLGSPTAYSTLVEHVDAIRGALR